MGIRDGYLSVLDQYRGQLDTLWGLRLYDVLMRVSTWPTGTLPGAQGATKAAVDTPVVVAGGARPKVEQLVQRDVLASGGLYQDQDLKIGPLTPKSAGFPAGVDPATFDPLEGSNVEVLFQLTGPAFPTGAWFKKIGQQFTGTFGLYLIVRKTGAQNA